MAADPRDPPFGSVWAFFALTFALSWGLVGLFLVAPGPVEALFGPVRAAHPLFILGVYSPAIAAFILVLRHGGWRGLRGFLARLLLWRAPIGWYLLLLLGLPAVSLLGAAIGGNLTREALAQPPLGTLLALVGFMLILGPIEEFGWRGYALPLLQRRMAPVWAGLLVGVIWGLWHLPAFYLGGTPQSDWAFLPFLIGIIAVSVILTAFFNAARGSILVAVLFHWQLNMPMWPDAQPWDMYLFAALALAVTWAKRDAMFSREGAATRIMQH
ncbi:type II CAAX endopeptidase family protein [Alkalilacustris brevis]|uniref:type II CAAX endopeptidase family protein n=1 Tax=Alkalilacustris brevis TaxID=2026338 RepID=UPI000E0D97B0|nr:type II CAAX endopeptidase family protein [Alkalilacustris brevis]